MAFPKRFQTTGGLLGVFLHMSDAGDLRRGPGRSRKCCAGRFSSTRSSDPSQAIVAGLVVKEVALFGAQSSVEDVEDEREPHLSDFGEKYRTQTLTVQGSVSPVSLIASRCGCGCGPQRFPAHKGRGCIATMAAILDYQEKTGPEHSNPMMSASPVSLIRSRWSPNGGRRMKLIHT